MMPEQKNRGTMVCQRNNRTNQERLRHGCRTEEG